MAQLAQMSTEGFENFYFDVCNIDYDRMSKAMQPLKELMDATDQVRLVAPGTDLSFSLKDISAVCCDGHRNVPDGEVFTAPVRDSINGTIQYNTPTLYQGVTHEDIRFEFIRAQNQMTLDFFVRLNPHDFKYVTLPDVYSLSLPPKLGTVQPPLAGSVMSG